ncbi:MAG TPA: CPBP family intramembrane metalloprotease [Polyangiaceae bacterium]|nr:CPBP family intramembrane metalloprotease [Polyangiaceae bacterium]
MAPQERTANAPRPAAPPTRRTLALLACAAIALTLERSVRTFPYVPGELELFAVVLAKSAVLAAGFAGARALGHSPRALGLAWPSPRGRPLMALAVVAAAVGGVALGQLDGVRAHSPLYEPARSSVGALALSTCLFAAYAFAWELTFRGVLLFGAAPLLGRASLVAQAAVFALAHLGKPGVELALAFPGGLAFGLLALRARSVVAPFAAHVALALAVNVACIAPRLR